MSGTTPEGARNEEEAARWVRDMFDGIAGRYDLANHLLSVNIDRYWRARTVRRVRHILERPDARVLDICCGTGDLALGLARHKGILATDFSHPMLMHAKRKIRERHAGVTVFESDAMRLPLRDASLDLITVAFGFRNLATYEAGLVEMRRVLRRGGAAAILEFSAPTNAMFATFYHFFTRRLLPRIGAAITGSRKAYEYLPDSVRKFPAADELASQMRNAGFANVQFLRMTGGAVALHLGYA